MSVSDEGGLRFVLWNVLCWGTWNICAIHHLELEEAGAVGAGLNCANI